MEHHLDYANNGVQKHLMFIAFRSQRSVYIVADYIVICSYFSGKYIYTTGFVMTFICP